MSPKNTAILITEQQRDWLRLVSSLMVEDGVALCAVILLATTIMSPMSVKGFRVSGTSVPLTGRRTNDTSLLFLFSMRYPHQVGGGNGGYHGKLFYL